MDKPLDQMSIIEIKALIYDHITSIEKFRSNIVILTNELKIRENVKV